MGNNQAPPTPEEASGLKLCELGQECVLPAGARIVSQGESPEFFYVIQSGRVRVFRETEDHIRTPLTELGPGTYFGEVALVTGQPRSASVEAVTEARLIKVSQEEIAQRVQYLAAMYGIPAEKFIKDLQKRNGFIEIYDQVMNEKVLDLLEKAAQLEEVAPGRQHERVLGVRLLDGGLVLDGEEAASAAGQRRAGCVQVRRAGVVEVGARPLHAVLLEPVVADSVPVRRQVGELVPDRLGVRIVGPVRSERFGHQQDDLAVDLRLTGQRRGRAYPTDAPLRVGERAALLGKTHARQEHIRIARGFRGEYLLQYHEIQRFQALAQKYGTGTVVRREGDGDDAKITVNFPRFGLKKLVEKYAGLKRN